MCKDEEEKNLEKYVKRWIINFYFEEKKWNKISWKKTIKRV